MIILFIGNYYWIGMTDLKEGDQSKAIVKEWYPGYGAKGTGSNCVA